MATMMAPWSIRKKLQVLLLVIFLPAVAVIVVTGLNQRRSEIEEARSNALLMVKSLTAQQEQMASSTKAILILLAQLPAVQDRNAKGTGQGLALAHTVIVQRHFAQDESCLAEIPMHSCSARSHGFRDGIRIKDRPSSPIALEVRICLFFQGTIRTKG